ncbi:3D domain-containing protein [Sporomusa malonica]|uniref:3D (Asp-Asp-Asp) domain-containing protein n=1 Tax=Sporomusa malonica TaxID=112901 RepID=A0A1W1ZUG3_9FIRM|nr:3D domain-containing protein [Sporomusa malonica]SMC51996.1 3D (Asp-Asp-Asp) domain-containing protein [Sporomusa malonica]
MNHKVHHKHSKSLKRRLKRMAAAAAVAGAAFVSSAFMPGLPATAHASALPDNVIQPETTVQQMVKTSKGTFNLQTDSRTPLKKLARAQAKAAAQQAQQVNNQAMADKRAANKQITKKVQATPVTAKAATNAPDNFQKVLDVRATAYAPGPHDNGPWGDKTHIGTTVRPGIIAVDPNIIPLGSRVYVEYPDGTGQYAVAEDTGGAIKGNRIDVALSSVGQAYDFGIKNAKVYVLGPKA